MNVNFQTVEKEVKKILDVCCGPRMFWFDKQNPDVVFMDIRRESFVACDGRSIKVDPDVLGDFRDIPYPDKSFKLVVFDPPILTSLVKTVTRHRSTEGYSRRGRQI